MESLFDVDNFNIIEDEEKFIKQMCKSICKKTK